MTQDRSNIFSVAGCADMLTLMAMRWNQQKFDNFATSLSRRYLKVITLWIVLCVCECEIFFDSSSRGFEVTVHSIIFYRPQKLWKTSCRTWSPWKPSWEWLRAIWKTGSVTWRSGQKVRKSFMKFSQHRVSERFFGVMINHFSFAVSHDNTLS